MVTSTVPITTMPAPANTPPLQTIPTVTVWTTTPKLGMELLPILQRAYQKDQQARTCAR
jgi:hypothetical protein